jgi:hypothetical protein
VNDDMTSLIWRHVAEDEFNSTADTLILLYTWTAVSIEQEVGTTQSL